MSLLPNYAHQIVDAVGKAVSGGLLYTYVGNGGTTLKTAYSDADLVTPHANPIVADADGVLPPIYLTPGAPYRFVEKTPGLVELRDADEVYSAILSGDSIVTRVYQIAASPLDYGAEGDGTTDDAVAVRAAITASTGVVDLLGFEFKCDTALIAKSGLSIINGTLDFSACTDDNWIEAHGTLGSANLLTGNVAYAESVLPVTTVSGLAAGDLVNLYAAADYIDGMDRGELCEILSIASLNLSLQSYIHDDYTTATSGAIKKLTTIDDFSLVSVTLLGAAGISGTTNGVSLRNCRRARLTNVSFQACDNTALVIDGCWDTLVEGCEWSGGVYGVGIYDASQHTTLTDCRFSGMTSSVEIGAAALNHASAAQGIPRNTEIIGGWMRSGVATTSSQVLTSQNSQHVVLDGIDVMQSGTSANLGFICANADLIIRNCRILRQGAGTPNAIAVSTVVPLRTSRNYSVAVTNNYIDTDGAGIIYTAGAPTGGAGVLAYLEILNNKVRVASTGVTITGGSSANNGNITQIQVRGNDIGGSLTITAAHTNITFDYVNVSDNRVSGTTAISHDVASRFTDLVLDNNNFAAVNLDRIVEVNWSGGICGAVDLDDCVIISINNVPGTTTFRIDNPVTAFSKCHLVNVCAYGGVDTHALHMTPSLARSADLKIIGGSFIGTSGTDHNCINITGYVDGLRIIGAYVDRADDGDPAIEINGGAAGGITLGLVSGCVIVDGDYAILATNITSVYSGINTLSGQSQAIPTNGLSNPTYTFTNATIDADMNVDVDADVAASIGDGFAHFLNFLETTGLVIRS